MAAMKQTPRFARPFSILMACAALSCFAQPNANAPLNRLSAYLNQIGFAQFEQRAQTVAAIRTKDEAERRKAEVRKKILDLMGGLPKVSGPVAVKEFGSVPGEEFRVEKIAYESLPGYYVTANVFVPSTGGGPFPAVIITPGHGPAGKLGEYNWGANLARAGVMTLAIDVFGQGERLQHYDPELEASKVERSGEHEHASLSTALVGQHVGRYFVNDGIRGVDYLTQRKDVDAKHIGAFGCSGGGTATAYLAALDPRISVAATACYITSFKELLPTTGPQDAEQTIPGFLAAGLDLADWVELCAPRPYAIVSTSEDMFPFAGARATYEEAKKLYALYGSEDKIEWITGPGGHGNLGPISKQILGFLLKHLKNDSATPEFAQFRPKDQDALLVTPSGQVLTSIGGVNVETLNRKEAVGRLYTAKPITAKADLASVQSKLRGEIRATAKISAEPGAPPTVTVTPKEQKDSYRVEAFTMQSEAGIELEGLAAAPVASGVHPAVLWMDSLPKERIVASPDLTRLAASGHVMVAFQPRGVLTEIAPAQASLLALGPYMGISLRSIVVGKTITGMRVDDTIRAMNWIVSRPDVDKTSITIYGRGALGMVALHAAALDTRITKVVAEGTLTSYRMALDAALHRNLSELAIPGILQHYDVAEVLEAISPRAVTIVNPVSALGQPARDQVVKQYLAAAFDSDKSLGMPDRIRLVRRGFRDPAPID